MTRINGRPVRVTYRQGINRDRLNLAAELRAMNWTWVCIAEVMRDEYRVNGLTAMRWAHGWSQRDAAEQWGSRWPDEPKTFKQFSSWEQWPGPTGRAPALATLVRLAELYGCAVADLLAGYADFRHLDPCRFGSGSVR